MSDLVACFQVVGSDPVVTDACIVFGFWAGAVVYVDFEVEGVTWGGDDLLDVLAVVILNTQIGNSLVLQFIINDNLAKITSRPFPKVT